MTGTWLHKFADSMVEVESPQRFFFWAGMAVLSSIVKKNVYLDKFRYILYPNIYVITVASSGLKKGIPVMYANKLARSVKEVRVLNGKYSIEGMLKELSTQRTTSDGITFSKAQALVLAPELKSLLRKDPDAIATLTDLQNTHEHEEVWSNTLKSSPVEELKEPCITLLGASNEAYLEETIKGADIEGGFIGRTFIIYENKTNVINSLMWPPTRAYPKEELESYLKELAKIKGAFRMRESSRVMFDEWYKKLRRAEYNDRTGTLNRLDDQVLKAAMLVALSKDFDLVIDDEIMAYTIEICEENFAGTRRVAEGEGKSPITKFTGEVIKHILDSPNYEIERKKLLDRGYPHFTSIELEQVYEAIGNEKGTGLIMMIPKNGKIYYKMSEENANALKDRIRNL